MLIFWIKQAWKQLTVVDIGRCKSITADESVVEIDAVTIVVPVVIDVDILSLARI